METEKLKDFFERNEFTVYPTEQDGIQCAEIEKWTDGGVDMIIWLNPFTIEEFQRYVEDFRIDEEIDVHRQGEGYKMNFTISQSLKDFSDFHSHLKDVSLMLDKHKK